MILSALILGVIFVVIFLFIKFVKEDISLIINLHQLPGPPAKNVFVGNLSPILDTPENVFKVGRKWGLDYYPIYHSWALHKAVANIISPEDFETILSNMKHNTKGEVYDTLHGWLGTGLLTSEGNKWQVRRKILTPAFHFNILQEFIKIFHEETGNLVDKLKKECHKEYIPVTEYISDFTLNTIGETAMGTSFGAANIDGQKYKKAIHEIGKLIVYRLCRPWLQSNLLYFFDSNYHQEKKLLKTLHDFTNNVIENREKNFNPDQSEGFSYSAKKRLAMLDLLLTEKREQGSIDDKGIREEVDTFMFEGHDTTSVAICYALMLLACHPQVQERIVEEIQQVVSDSKADYKTLQDLKYMEQCIKEVLRLYPSVAFIARKLGEDITTHSGHVLKAGSPVHLHIYDLHHNPELYPDPEKFDPDRFLPGNTQKRHPFAYLPFSAGPRNCIGQKFAMLEIKCVLAGILSEFVLEPVDTPATIIPVADLVIRTKDSIKVRFVPRRKQL